ncbi:hypothetical protein HHI36_011461 [Cryptolaemus montrouzieri]|uniref:DUF19 domain-containing protein n=1 Tax=Cryptolaemus montrouzieri TaxID=559131 RepID=A0ABD2MLS8_9CUCU
MKSLIDNMKFLIVLIGILAVVHSLKYDFRNAIKKIRHHVKEAQTPSSSEELEDLLEEGLKEMTRDIELEVCDRNNTKLYEAAIKATECVKNTKLDLPMCEVFTKNFRKCALPIQQDFEGCVDLQFHEIPKFIVDAITHLVEFVCDAKVREIIELANPCLDIPEDKCFQGIAEKLDNVTSSKNLKKEICTEILRQKECFVSETTKNCQFDITKKTFSKLMDSLTTKPCAD